ncbi:Uncharacterised protein [Mycobacteroides abscessus subsp. abscessus]|nr:Uncharacterised protein [Mycobacteroides abscessus subsp. abscessus]
MIVENAVVRKTGVTPSNWPSAVATSASNPTYFPPCDAMIGS